MKTPTNPSRRATARVKNPLPVPTTCNLCEGEVRIAKHKEIYNGRTFGDWPYAYLCTRCRAYVGLHPFTAIPLGTLADGPLRKARTNSKNVFVQLYERGHMSRNDAYQTLADKMGIPKEECHFGWFTLAQCQQAEYFSRQIFLTM